MSDPDIHLKLDRILAGQKHILARVAEHQETIGILIAAMTTLKETIGTQTETIKVLSEAMSREEGGGDLVEAIASIAAALKQIQQDGARTVVLLGRMPNVVAKAAQDAVTLATGGGVDIPPGNRE
ncbi:MAG TPA: hypothetical protein VKI44_35080 [Acetobacteraceae bacterium]|nr:hypothetical protein [Acetobacteraceae bacterium]